MRLCPTCERPRDEGSKTCSGCGRPYPAGLANLPDIVGFGHGKGATRARSLLPRRPAAFAAIAVAIVLVAGGIGAVWLFGRHKPSPLAGPAPGPTAPAVPSGAAAPSGSPSPPPPSPSANPGQAVVTVAGAASQDASASSVAAFLAEYFTAINLHHYHAYKVLHDLQQQQGLSRAGFNSGYQGSRDSAIRLVNIVTASDGDTQAVLKFTSHQAPTLADNEEPCTKWSISLFLVREGSGYLLDAPPPGYLAASAPCS